LHAGIDPAQPGAHRLCGGEMPDADARGEE
jgi:hypothetical protein